MEKRNLYVKILLTIIAISLIGIFIAVSIPIVMDFVEKKKIEDMQTDLHENAVIAGIRESARNSITCYLVENGVFDEGIADSEKNKLDSECWFVCYVDEETKATVGYTYMRENYSLAFDKDGKLIGGDKVLTSIKGCENWKQIL